MLDAPTMRHAAEHSPATRIIRQLGFGEVDEKPMHIVLRDSRRNAIQIGFTRHVETNDSNWRLHPARRWQNGKRTKSGFAQSFASYFVLNA